MDYAAARPHIATGDVLFFRGKLLHARIIQRWTRSVYSHVGIAVWIRADGVRRLCVLEALEGHGVRLYPLSRYIRRGDAVDWWSVAVDGFDRDKAVGWALMQLGARYASPWQFLRSFSVLTKRVCDWLGLPTRIDADRWFCSAYSVQFLLAGGWRPDADLHVDAYRAAPGDAARLPCLRMRGPLTFHADSVPGGKDAA